MNTWCRMKRTQHHKRNDFNAYGGNMKIHNLEHKAFLKIVDEEKDKNS